MASAQIQGNKWLIENQAQQTKNKCVIKQVKESDSHVH